jgi:hypothetical protein
MRNKVLLASFAVLLLILTVSSVSVDADDTSAAYYIDGYVADATKMPKEGVTVSVADRNNTWKYQEKTNKDGYFRVGAGANTNLVISFTMDGYTAITCPNTTFLPGSEYLVLNLSKATYSSATRTYTITGSVEDMQCAIVGVSDGDVIGVVSFDGTPIKGALVVLRSTSGRTHAVYTDERGAYTVTCPTGVYSLSAGGKGFERSEEQTVNVSAGIPYTANVTLVKSELTNYYGLDAAHILMLVGAILGIMLAFTAWFLSRRTNRPNGLEIIDDSEEDEFR